MLVSKGKTYSDKKWNEDVYSISDSYILVLDGATGLSKHNIMSEDDALWFVDSLKNEIIQRMHMDSLQEIIKESIVAVQKEYKQESISKEDMPSGCISLFREKEDCIEYIGIGDCVGIIQLNDGSVETLLDTRIEEMDNEVIQHMIEISKKESIPFLETRKYVNPQLLFNRTLRNTGKGYYALDLTVDCFEGIIYKKWNKKDVKRIACMSDGFYQIFSFTEWNENEVLNQLDNNMDSIFEYLYSLQEKDADCSLVPRLRKRDDTTVVFANINK